MHISLTFFLSPAFFILSQDGKRSQPGQEADEKEKELETETKG